MHTYAHNTYIHARIHSHIHIGYTHSNACIHIYTCTYIYAYIHTYICMHIYIYSARIHNFDSVETNIERKTLRPVKAQQYK